MADSLKGFSEETVRRVSNVGDAIKEIKQQTRDLNRELSNAGAPLSDWESSFSKISNLSRKILDTQDKSLRSSKGTGESLKRQNEARNTARALDVKINELLRQRVQGNDILNDLINRQASNLREAKDQAKILVEEYGKLAESAASLDKKTLFFSKLAEFTKDVKGLRVFSSPFEAAAKASREQVLQNEKAVLLQKKLEELRTSSNKSQVRKEISEITEGKTIKEVLAGKGGTFGAGMKAFTGEIAGGISGFLKGGGPLLIGLQLLAKAIQFFVDAMFAADERVTKIAKGLAFSKDESRALYNNFKESKHEINSIYNLTKDYNEAFTDLVDLSDFAVIANEKMVETQIILTKNLNLSKEEAFGIQDAFAASNIEADKGLEMVSEQVAAFSNQNKLLTTNKKTLADIAKTSKLIQINFNGNLNSLVKTTLEAKKLGLTLDQISKIGSSLLNFEQSISSELEAELLTGRDLNLERARAYALNHDIAGLTQEISRQGITQEKFANMNVIQQEAIARALGMSAEEMGDMLYKQKLIAKYGGDTVKNLKKEIELAQINHREQDAAVLQKKLNAIEQGILDGKSALEAEKSATAQEKFNQSLEQAKEIFSDFVDGEYLDQLADAIKAFSDMVVGASGRENRAKKISSDIKSSENYKKYTPEQQNIVNRLEKASSDQVGFWEWAQSLVSGTLPLTILKNKASRNSLEALTTIKNKGFKGTSTEINADDFVIKTHPKDTIVAAGGTSLGNSKEMVQLLTEQNRLLAGILNKEGIITLNGTKMGTAMAVGGYKVQ